MQPLIVPVLVVGGGATGALLAAALAAARGPAAGVALWEKSSSTGRVSHSAARGAGAGALADLGAQYFSEPPPGDASAGARAARARLAELVAARVLAPLAADALAGVAARHAGGVHHVAPRGAGSVVAHFRDAAARGGVAVALDRRLVSLEAVRGGGGGGAAGSEAGVAADGEAGGALLWRAEDESGAAVLARAVVLTIPAPQVLGLRGAALGAALAPVAPALRAVAYSSRIALALHFDAAARAALDALAPWTGAFCDAAEGGGVVRYLSYETRKREAGGGAAGGAPTLVAHSTVEYGARHAATPDFRAALLGEMSDAALGALAARAGVARDALPRAADARVHRWLYSQVTARFAPDAPAPGALLLQAPDHAPLVLAGDYMAAVGNFGGAAESAEEAARLLATLGAA